MARAPLVLLLAAAAPAAAGLWEEVGRNADITASASVSSDRLGLGRAPDLGPVADLGVSATLSVPGSGINLVAAVSAARSLDGSPRLDQRTLGLSLGRFGESSLLSVGVAHDLNLGANPAAPSRSFGETTFDVGGQWKLGAADGPWVVDLALYATPRREETVAEAALIHDQALGESLRLQVNLAAGTLRATDADGDGQGRVEGWSYGRLHAALLWTPTPGTLYYIGGASQAATEAPGRLGGRISLGWERTF